MDQSTVAKILLDLSHSERAELSRLVLEHKERNPHLNLSQLTDHVVVISEAYAYAIAMRYNIPSLIA